MNHSSRVANVAAAMSCKSHRLGEFHFKDIYAQQCVFIALALTEMTLLCYSHLRLCLLKHMSENQPRVMSQSEQIPLPCGLRAASASLVVARHKIINLS